MMIAEVTQIFAGRVLLILASAASFLPFHLYHHSCSAPDIITQCVVLLIHVYKKVTHLTFGPETSCLD